MVIISSDGSSTLARFRTCMMASSSIDSAQRLIALCEDRFLFLSSKASLLESDIPFSAFQILRLWGLLPLSPRSFLASVRRSSHYHLLPFYISQVIRSLELEWRSGGYLPSVLLIIFSDLKSSALEKESI